ncbi:hypothetical protein Tco_1334771 [Tanacetum coccineum]
MTTINDEDRGGTEDRHGVGGDKDGGGGRRLPYRSYEMRPCYFSPTSLAVKQRKSKKLWSLRDAFQKIFSISSKRKEVLLRETIGFDSLILILKLRGTTFTQQ